MTAARPRALRPAQWALSQAPRGVLPFYLATELIAVVAVLLLPATEITRTDWALFGALFVIGAVQAELSLGTEKIRLYLADAPHINMTSVWIFGGAVVLPPLVAVLLVVAIYGHLWLRVWRPINNRPAYRVLFSSSTIVLSCLVVAPILRMYDVDATLADGSHAIRTLLAVVVAGFVYTSVNAVLIAVGVRLHYPTRRMATLFGTSAENALEFGTLCLGGLTGAVLVTFPALVALMLLPIVVLHRNVLMRQLEEKAAQDSKTGLLTDAEWKSRLAGELARNERRREPFGVLIIDLDRFKRVNDTYGHVSGDVVLRAVADVIRAQLRAYDSVGRWGGEEFAVLLPQIDEGGARDVAERVRDAIAHLEVKVAIDDDQQNLITGLSVSIGVTAHPTGGTTVDGLLHAADTAMYRAKRAGRNTVKTIAEDL